MGSFLNIFFQNVKMLRIRDVLDIIIVAYVIYKGVKLVSETRAVRLIKGIVILVIVMQLSGWLQLNAVNFILVNTMEVGLLAIIIVFQPELRRALEKMGGSSISKIISDQEAENDGTIKQIVNAANHLSASKTGALIILERDTNLADVISTGISIESVISSQLLENIFVPNTPLHDGAVIIGDDKIKAAACVLPLSESKEISSELGTRHRAAIGLAEVTDCISIVVSEETGRISVASNGYLTRNVTTDELTNILITSTVKKTPEVKSPKDKLVDLVVRRK